ncbi:MAG: DNA polymerase III subunit [Clostridiales bacterium]|nr:DNA polymerase III subunit [Clostridiales bacterium]
MFENIKGNEENKKILSKIINEKKIGHSYMFVGQTGIGKMLFAKEFAKAVLCLQEKQCNNCKSCLEFANNNNPDITIIEKEEDSNVIKIDQIRQMTSKILEKPIISNKKVYIINDSELMTEAAQNSLLKTLEEPPEYATIILITSREDLFLNTIKSRCTKIMFNKLSNEDLKQILKIKYNYENISNNMFLLFDGSVERALNLIDKEKEYEELSNIINNLEKYNVVDVLNLKEKMFKQKEEARGTLDYINLLFYNLVKKDIRYANCMKAAEKAKEKLTKNNNYDMTIDNFLLTIWEELND